MRSKDFLRVDAAIDNHFKTNKKQRDFVDAKRMKLFELGEELFNNGYDYDEFVADIVICFIAPKEKANDIYEQMRNKYLNIKTFPDLNTIIKVATNLNYVQTIKNGYNRAKRLEDINNGKKIENNSKNPNDIPFKMRLLLFNLGKRLYENGRSYELFKMDLDTLLYGTDNDHNDFYLFDFRNSYNEIIGDLLNYQQLIFIASNAEYLKEIEHGYNESQKKNNNKSVDVTRKK